MKITVLFVCTISFFLFYTGSTELIGEEEAHEQVGEIVYGVQLEAHHHIVKRQADEPIRLKFVFHNESINMLPSFVTDSLLPSIKRRIESMLMVRRTNVPILLNRQCTDGSFFLTTINDTIPCNNTCANETLCGLMVVPEEQLKACVQCNGSSSTCEQVGSNGEGVSNVDLLIYVTAIQDPLRCSSTQGVGAISTLAFASTCQLESGLDRPIAGFINYCPNAIGSSMTAAQEKFVYYVTLHELIHTLGFTKALYPFWRTENGEPRTERDANGLPPIIVDENGIRRFDWSNTTIQEVTNNDWYTANGFVNHTVNIMVTPKVVEHGRRHFNCSTLQGVELENQGGPATAISHWEKRILGNELMTGVIDARPVLSNLTLALLEDSGWYKVNYSAGQTLDWGHYSGCNFASQSCLYFDFLRSADSFPANPFCFSPPYTNNILTTGCTVGRHFVSMCNLVQYSNPIPREYQYFTTPTFGGRIILADYCPFDNEYNYIDGRTTRCSNATNQLPANQNLLGETYGTETACFNQADIWTFTNSSSVISIPVSSPIRGSGCYMYTCNADSTELTIFVLGFPYTCKEPGQTLMVDNNGYKGQFTCPEIPSFKRLCEQITPRLVVTPSPTPTPTMTPTMTPDGATMPSSTAMITVLLMLLLLVAIVEV